MSSDRTVKTVLHSAYTFIRSVEVNKAAASLTLDHLIQEQIDSYEQSTTRPILDAKGQSLGKRISKLDALDTLKQQVESVVKSIKDAGSDQQRLAELGITEEET